MLVDVEHGEGHDRITINLDVLMYRMPCEALTLDVQDVMGMHISDIRGDVIRRKIDKNGNHIGEQQMIEAVRESNQEFIQHLSKQLDDQEGCHIFGHFNINRAPGIFRISTHSRDQMTLSKIIEQGHQFNFTYKINHLSFGTDVD